MILKEKMDVKKITEENFEKYGCIIEYLDPKVEEDGNSWKIIVQERRSLGWRIAYLIVRNKTFQRLEKHPESMESFEPIKGEAILYVSDLDVPSKIEAFLLDKPIILKKGIWHAITAKTEDVHVKICENHEVECVFYKL